VVSVVAANTVEKYGDRKDCLRDRSEVMIENTVSFHSNFLSLKLIHVWVEGTGISRNRKHFGLFTQKIRLSWPEMQSCCT
jgi:hypothetical protein